jgi:hydrogenase 3 maturation protease
MSEKKVLFLGIGNKFKGDDGFGIILTEKLNNFKSKNLFFLQCQEVPENYIGKILELRPDIIVFVDTIYSPDSPPGEIILLEEFNPSFSISTHAGSLKTIIDFLRLEGLEFKSYLLGVVPEQINMGDEISPQVERAITQIYDNFEDYLEKFSHA